MNGRFEHWETAIAGLKCLRRKLIGDSRGYLERLFCAEELHGFIEGRAIAQINHTLTERRGTVRGMHFQYPPYGEVKFVSCLRGEVFDVAVDLRRHSPTFLHWHAEILSEHNYRTLVIPEGFAHGFQSLTDHCEMLYFHTAPYHPESEGALNALDPRLAIVWPLKAVELSVRDREHVMLNSNFEGIDL